MATELARSLTAPELIAKNICPVKKEYVSTYQERKHVEAVGSVAGCNEQAAEKKSNRQLKKERKEEKAVKVCSHYIRGTCTFGASCKYNHDLTEVVRQRSPDLPGECPFSCTPACPYGLLCKWATKHKNPDELTKKWLFTKLPQCQGDEIIQEQNFPSCKSSSDVEVYVLPTPSEIVPSVNALNMALTNKLRKNSYDFSRAKIALKSMSSTAQSRRDRQNNTKDYDMNKTNNRTDDPECTQSCPAKETNSQPPNETDQTCVAISSVSCNIPPMKNGEPEGVQSYKGKGNQDSSVNMDPPLKKQKVTDDDILVPIYDISKTSNTERGIHKRDGKPYINFSGKLYCAPLTTVGNLPFRRIAKQFGCDITCGEMAVTANLLKGQQSEWALLKRHPCEDIFGVQIAGSHADSIARCVQLLEDNISVDFIDINMGCPIDLICNKGMGSALIQRPQRMRDIVSVASAVAQDTAITFKTRTGFADKLESRNAARVISSAASWGACAVTVHGRTRQQRYSKLADWEYIQHCASVAPPGLQVIGNGDIFSWDDYQAHMSAGQLSSCMIARGALIKPWVFTEIKERRNWDISAAERLDMLKEFCKCGIEHWGSDKQGVEKTRRFLLEWLSFLCRYVPVGLLEVIPQQMTWRPPAFYGRSDLETLLGSTSAADWVKISEMLLGPAPQGFSFVPKHKSNAYEKLEKSNEADEVQG